MQDLGIKKEVMVHKLAMMGFISFFASICNGLPNIKLSLEIMKTFAEKDGGAYIRSDAIEKALIPGIQILAQHLVALEDREKMQEAWLTVVTAIGGLTMGTGFMFFIMRRMIAKKTARPVPPLESIKVEKK